MYRKTVILIISAALVITLALCGLTSFGMVQFARASNIVFSRYDHQSVEQSETRTFPAGGLTALEVFTERGDIQIDASPDAELVTVEIIRRAWGETEEQAQAAAQALNVDALNEGNALKLRFEGEKQPPVVLFGAHNPSSVSFVVTVPLEMDVMLQTQIGDISLAGTHGDATLKNFFGDVNVRGLVGALHAESIQNQEVSIQDVRAGQGEVQVNASFGKLEAQNVSARSVTMECSSCMAALTDVEAREKLTVRSDFNEIVLEDVRAGQAEIYNQNGAVTLRGGTVRGDLSVKSAFGKLEIRGVKAASYHLENQNGAIDLDGASGVVDVNTSFGDVNVTNARDVQLTLESQQGAVRFSGSLAADSAHTIATSFGDVILTIPPASAFDLNLEASFGKINSDFPVTLTGEVNETAWQGKINGGGPEIQVKTQNGNISIRALE